MLDTSKIKIRNSLDANGKPAGGRATLDLYDRCVSVDFQDGPIIEAKGRNGAFVEDLLYIAKVRLEFSNRSGFACDENHLAINAIDAAMAALQSRTQRRIEAGTEGTHEGT